MMAHKAKVISALVLTCLTGGIFATDESSGKWVFHSQLLKEKFDTSRWRQFYPDDSWRIRCIFVDMNGDGVDELVAATTSEEEDRVGWVWNVFQPNAAGKFEQVYYAGDIYFLCHWYSYYKVTAKNATYSVIGLGMEAGYEDKERRRIVKPTPDCVFSIVPGNKFTLHEIRPDVETWFRREDVVSIERLYPEWYFGYDFRPPRDIPHNPQTFWMPYRLPKGDLRRGGGITEAGDFAVFVEEHRRKVKMEASENNKVTIYAVHLDADNDGDADCYVSSDAERTDDGKFKWTLFLRRGKTFFNALEAVYPVEDHRELCKLNPRVTASRDSFCRVIRFDVDPLFLVLDNNAKGTVIREAITGCETHRVEKLVCVEYPERAK